MYFEGALLIVLFGFVSSAAMAKFLLRGEVIDDHKHPGPSGSEIVVAALLLASGRRHVLVAAWGLCGCRLLAAHACAGAGLPWPPGSSPSRRSCTSAPRRRPQLHVWLIIIVLSITAPITTMLLARAALFRRRQAGDPLPSPLRRRG
jgi:multicomponent K+:H+ antiporter subunit G